MPFFLSLFLLTLIPPTYAVSPPELDTPFVERCTEDFSDFAELSTINQFESDTDQMLAALVFNSAKAFSRVTSREVCICFQGAYSRATGPASPISLDDLWGTVQALERHDANSLDAIWAPLQSLPQEEKDRIMALFDGAGSVQTSCTSGRIQAIQETSFLFGLNLQIGAALGVFP